MFLNCLQLFYDKLRPVEASLSNPRISHKKVILSFFSVITIRTTKHLTILYLNILIGCDSVAFCCVNDVFVHIFVFYLFNTRLILGLHHEKPHCTASQKRLYIM